MRRWTSNWTRPAAGTSCRLPAWPHWAAPEREFLQRLYAVSRPELRSDRRFHDRQLRYDQLAALGKRHALGQKQLVHQRNDQRRARALQPRPSRRRWPRPARLRFAAQDSQANGLQSSKLRNRTKRAIHYGTGGTLGEYNATTGAAINANFITTGLSSPTGTCAVRRQSLCGELRLQHRGRIQRRDRRDRQRQLHHRAQRAGGTGRCCRRSRALHLRPARRGCNGANCLRLAAAKGKEDRATIVGASEASRQVFRLSGLEAIDSRKLD